MPVKAVNSLEKTLACWKMPGFLTDGKVESGLGSVSASKVVLTDSKLAVAATLKIYERLGRQKWTSLPMSSHNICDWCSQKDS